ncbi:MAG TPA: pitrilysin family protein [Planctomycetota bacterium]|jgi:predicted Zn-dependent peptidase|nr:pitrilysin family protein [Planctomycetota bacterium]
MAIAPLLLAGVAALAPPGESPKIEVVKHTLKNGLRLLVVERPDSPTVSTQLRFLVGGVDDPKGETGIAHLLEHMMFKGSETMGIVDREKEKPLLDRLDVLWAALDAERERQGSPFATPDPEKIRGIQKEIEMVSAEHRSLVVKDELWQAYQRVGGQRLNASTNDDATQYYVDLPKNQLEMWAYFEADRLANPVFREFYSERDVVHEERRLRTDTQPQGKFQEAMATLAHPAHPYRNPVVGWPSDIDGLSRAEVLEYFKTFYAPNNCIVALVGDVKAAEAIALVEKTFGSIPAKAQPRRRITEEPPMEGERRLKMKLDAAPQVAISWPAVATGHPDAPALSVAARVLTGSGGFGGGGGRGRFGGGGGGTGRFYKRLVDPPGGEGVAIAAFAMHRGGRYPGVFAATATPAPGQDLAVVEEALGAEVERLAKEPPAEEELARVRNALDASWVRSLDSNAGIAGAILQAEALAGDWSWWLRERELTKAVTAPDVARVVEKYLRRDTRCVGWLEGTREDRPGRRARPSEAAAPAREGGVR